MIGKAVRSIVVAVLPLAMGIGGATLSGKIAGSRWDNSHPPAPPGQAAPVEAREAAVTKGEAIGFLLGCGLAVWLLWEIYRQTPEEIEKAGHAVRVVQTVVDADVGVGPYPRQAADQRIHNLIVTAGLVPAVLLLGVGVVGFIRGAGVVAAGGAGMVKTGMTAVLIFGGFVLAAFALGAGTACLFAPTSFYRGPIGQKWLGFIGAKSVFKARLACLVALVLVVCVVKTLIDQFN